MALEFAPPIDVGGTVHHDNVYIVDHRGWALPVSTVLYLTGYNACSSKRGVNTVQVL